MKHVVITGSTRGIGLGLAKEFLQAGCRVTISGRSGESVNAALQTLKSKFSDCSLHPYVRQGEGQIFNMEGFGSNGMMREQMTLYGTSKSALTYFTKSLALEAKQTNIKVGTLSPGMVATDFLKKSLDEKNKRIFNILGDKVEPVTKFLAAEILKNQENGANIEWLTKPKIIWRFASSMFVRRDIFE